MELVRIQRLKRQERLRLQDLLFVQITDAGEVVWHNLCPKDITLRLRNGRWGLKRQARLVGRAVMLPRSLPVQFFKIGAKLRRFCGRCPGTIAVLNSADDWQMAAFRKTINRLVRWGVLVQASKQDWPRIATEADREARAKAKAGAVLDMRPGLV